MIGLPGLANPWLQADAPRYAHSYTATWLPIIAEHCPGTDTTDTLQPIQRSQYVSEKTPNDLQPGLLESQSSLSTPTQETVVAAKRTRDANIRFYQRVLVSAQRKGLHQQVCETHRHLSEAFAANGDYQKAYVYQRLYVASHDSLQRIQRTLATNVAVSTVPVKVQMASLPNKAAVSEPREWPLIGNTLFLASGMASLLLTFLLYRSNRRTQRINRLLRRQNSEIRHQKALLVAQRDNIKEKSQKMEMLNFTKDKFFSIVAHDLRGPINSLSSFSTLLANDLPRLSPQEIKVIAQELNKSVKNTSQLTENLLTWARLQMNNQQHFPTPVDLEKVMEDTVALFQTTAQQKQITLRTEAEPGLQVYADDSHVRFILRNLTANAIKFTRHKGTVCISTQLEHGQVKISVSDNGVGIQRAVMEKLFRIDAKHSTAGTAGEKGTGLGLVLCKEFVEKNGGRLIVESEPGQGSTFAVYLQKQPEAVCTA